MNDPQRLLSGEADERERALLSAAQAEEPSADALSRLQQSLGLMVDPSPLFVPRAETQAQPGALEAAAGAGTSSSLLASKWLLLSGATLSLVGALVWSRAVLPDHETRALPAPAVVTSQPATPLPSGSEATPQAVPDVLHAAQPGDGTPVDAPTLRDELARLERVRTALHDRRAGVALTTLDDYDREHPRGALREEAEALRIETLFALDERQRASDLARRFMQSHPRSVHGARVSSQLEQRGAR